MTERNISDFIKNKDPRITENLDNDPIWNNNPWPVTPPIKEYVDSAILSLPGTGFRKRLLSMNTNLYIDSTGNDTNDGSINYPLKTWSGMINWLRQTDQQGNRVTILFAPGSYVGGDIVGYDITGPITITSRDSTDWARLTGIVRFNGIVNIFSYSPNDTNAVMTNIETGTLWFSGGCFCYIGNVNMYGTGEWALLRITEKSSVLTTVGSVLQFNNNASVLLETSLHSTFEQNYPSNNKMIFNDCTVAYATMNSSYFGYIYIMGTGVTLSGNVTGKRFSAREFGHIVAGTNIIPGTIDGTISADGRYS